MRPPHPDRVVLEFVTVTLGLREAGSHGLMEQVSIVIVEAPGAMSLPNSELPKRSGGDGIDEPHLNA